MTRNGIAQRMRSARKHKRLTQKQVSQFTGFSLRYIQKLEKEGTHNLRVIAKISEAIGCHSSEIIYEPLEMREMIYAAIANLAKSHKDD